MLVVASRTDISMPPPDDFMLMRSIRNEIQHSGDWVIPSNADVSLAFGIARAAADALDCAEAASVQPPVVREAVWQYMRFPAPPPMGARVLAGRKLAEVAWEVSSQIDPDQDGLHVRVLEDRLNALGVYGRSWSSVRDALNHAHDLFEAHGQAVWSWKQPARDVTEGIFGAALADLVAALLKANDPDARGMHAGRDILPILQSWGVKVRGQDMPATIRSALGRDSRFETVPDVGNAAGDRLRTAYRLRQ
jgi:hypothetical protein